MKTSLDAYLPTFQFSERHACRVDSEPHRMIDAVACYRPEEDSFFRAMIALREAPMRLSRRRQEKPQPFGLRNFTLLERSENEIVYGLIGQFWKADYGLCACEDGRAFQRFERPHVAKLVLGFSAQGEPDGPSRLITETRVYCPDRHSQWRFTPYWLMIRPVSGLIRRRILSSIKRASETQAQA